MFCNNFRGFKLRLRWRTRPGRIRRQGLVVGQSGLEILLLHSQLPATLEGTQLMAECPGYGTRSRQVDRSRISPGCAQWSYGANHDSEIQEKSRTIYNVSPFNGR